jgi:uncharacterized integral membrane protein (TIGR00698 family)
MRPLCTSAVLLKALPKYLPAGAGAHSAASAVSIKYDCRYQGQYSSKSTFIHQQIRYMASTGPPTPVNKEEQKARPTLVTKVMDRVPGVALSTGIMFAGFELAEHLGRLMLEAQGIVGGASPLSGIPVAILLGMMVKNFSPLNVDTRFQPGLKFCTTTVLRGGIICVGSKLSFLEIVSLGTVGVPIVMLSIGTTLLVTQKLGKYLGLSNNLTSLVAAGSSICGVTAITAVAPAINAKQQEISVAVANVVAFGTIGMLAYPHILPHLLSSSQQIGTVMGLAIHDTSQVMGAALTYQTVHGDDMVLKCAAVTKLTRNLFLAAVVPYLTLMSKKNDQALNHAAIGTLTENHPKTDPFQRITEIVPLFVIGFVGASAIRSGGDIMLASDMLAYGLFDASHWKAACNMVGNDIGGHYFLGTAMAAVGLSTAKESLKGVGYKPFVLGLAGASITACTGLTSVVVLGFFGLI